MMRMVPPFRPVLLLGLVGVCVWPLPVPEPWRIGVLPALALLSAAVLLAERRLPARIWVAAAAILALPAVYAFNPSHRWEEGVGLLPVAHAALLPRSAFPPGSWESLALASGLLAAFALAFQLTARQRKRMLFAAAAGAAAMAIAVLVQRLEPNRWSVYEMTGVFVNENHFAVFANLLLPVVLALASRARYRAVQEGRVSSPAGLFLLAALLLAGAVVMSRSRAGVTVMALLVLVHVGRCRRLVRQYPFMDTPVAPVLRKLGWTAFALAAALAVVAFAREWHQWADAAREWHFRLGILKDTLRAWLAQPAWGTGPGSFSAVFPYYQSGLLSGRTILHAHCEPVQWLSEYGGAGVLWMTGFAGLALSARPRGKRPSANGPAEIPAFADLERPALATGLLALGLHAGIDFPLRIPLIAMVAAVWAGLWAASRPAPSEAGGAP